MCKACIETMQRAFTLGRMQANAMTARERETLLGEAMAMLDPWGIEETLPYTLGAVAALLVAQVQPDAKPSRLQRVKAYMGRTFKRKKAVKPGLALVPDTLPSSLSITRCK